MSARAAVVVAALGALALAVAACGAAESSTPPTLIPDPDSGRDGGKVNAEAGSLAWPRLIVVNALTDPNGPFEGVVLCVNESGDPMPTRAMPLTNYPGIPVGGGMDLGDGLTGNVTLHVFDAATLAGNTQTCPDLVFNKGASAVKLTLNVRTNGATVVALMSDKSRGVTVRQLEYGDNNPFVPGRIQAHFANLSLAASPVKLTVDGTERAKLTTDLQASVGFEIDAKPEVKLVASHGAGAGDVAQALQSVQYASDPTSTPEAFFGVRGSFLFALVGDPGVIFDPNAEAKDLTGRELHIAAIPYGDGVPKK